MLTDAQVVTLCVAYSIMGTPSDRWFLRVVGKYPFHLLPEIPGQPGSVKRRWTWKRSKALVAGNTLTRRLAASLQSERSPSTMTWSSS